MGSTKEDAVLVMGWDQNQVCDGEKRRRKQEKINHSSEIHPDKSRVDREVFAPGAIPLEAIPGYDDVVWSSEHLNMIPLGPHCCLFYTCTLAVHRQKVPMVEPSISPFSISINTHSDPMLCYVLIYPFIYHLTQSSIFQTLSKKKTSIKAQQSTESQSPSRAAAWS